MKKYAYTERELSIIKTKSGQSITLEEYLSIFHKAYILNHLDIISYLCDTYPELTSQVSDDFIPKYCGPNDYIEYNRFPILSFSAPITEKFVLNLVTYITGQVSPSNSYKKLLKENVSYQSIFDYTLEEYIRAYNRDSLWHNYFLKQPELCNIIKARQINDLDTLIYRARNYIEKYILHR